MEKTCLQAFFDAIISSHDLGAPKEQSAFWTLLQQQRHFDPERTLLVDDNLAVLDAAKAFGISNLVSVSRPDSSQPKRIIVDYPAIEDFRALMVGL